MQAVTDALDGGWGYASDEWRTSGLGDWLRSEGRGAAIFSNNSANAYFLTHRPSRGLPETLDADSVSAFGRAMRERRGVLVRFPSDLEAGAPPDSLANRLGLIEMARFPEGVVWGFPRGKLTGRVCGPSPRTGWSGMRESTPPIADSYRICYNRRRCPPSCPQRRVPMHRVRIALLLLVAVCLGGVSALRAQRPAAAEYPGIETGKMWTFDVPPTEYWAQRYNFHPSQAWLDHVRLSAGRLPGCSASFVSPDGLVMSNHHCGRGCIDSATKPGEDLLRDGFYAKTRDEERPCRGMILDQLLGITDVTDSVNAAVAAGTAAARAVTLRDAAISGLEERCAGGAADIRCQVVSMYRGGQYKLYRFRHYTDLRLVFAVESQTGFFGGDPDNFTYPRYDLDMSIVRVYVNGQPAHTEYFRWSPNGSSDHELVFAVGNPGSTGRLNTVAQMEYLRDVQYPASLRQLADRIRMDHQLSGLSEERARTLRNELFGLENSYKAIDGYQAGLLNPRMMDHKREWERNFRARVNANADWKRLYGNAWDESAAVWHQLGQLAVRQRYYAFGAYGARLLQLASVIVRSPVEAAKPDSDRLPLFRDANKQRLQGVLASEVDTTTEIMVLTAYFAQMQKDLPAADPLLRAVLAGRTPEVAAREMVGCQPDRDGEPAPSPDSGRRCGGQSLDRPVHQAGALHRPGRTADHEAGDRSG